MNDLSRAERAAMLELMNAHFCNVAPERFADDLAEKESAILLYRGGELGGFSTLMRLHTVVDDVPVTAFYSGDTVVAPAFQGYSELSRLWSRHTFALAAALRRGDPRRRVFWLLISAGYKTYRFLPLFYRRFHPAFDAPTPPFEGRVVERLARAKFGPQYDAQAGVVRFSEASPLRPGVAEVTGARRRDPHVTFFLAANPGHAQGDELVCLTELHPDNLTAAGRRMVGARRERA